MENLFEGGEVIRAAWRKGGSVGRGKKVGSRKGEEKREVERLQVYLSDPLPLMGAFTRSLRIDR